MYTITNDTKDYFKHTGEVVEDKLTNTKYVVIREWGTGQILACESVTPTVFCTFNSWNNLEVVE